MSIRRLHRLMGCILLLPFVAWSITGMIFFIKPGYGKAYAPLPIPTKPLEEAIQIPAMPEATELRVINTILGPSLLARTQSGWQHLDGISLEPRPEPSTEVFRKLVESAIAADPERYGRIDRIEDKRIFTTTGVRIQLSWPTMRLSQYGRDTGRIDWLYRVHYLQWTGHKPTDKVLGFVGLVLVMAMALSGLRMLIRRPD